MTDNCDVYHIYGAVEADNHDACHVRNEAVAAVEEAVFWVARHDNKAEVYVCRKQAAEVVAVFCVLRVLDTLLHLYLLPNLIQLPARRLSAQNLTRKKLPEQLSR